MPHVRETKYTLHNGEFPTDPFNIDDEYLEIKQYQGFLSVDFTRELMEKGSFKTSHPGTLRLDNNVNLPPFTNHMVCVKQIYEKWGPEGKIGRVPGWYEADVLSVECNVLQWASILLDMTYQFIDREITVKGSLANQSPDFILPELWLHLLKLQKKRRLFLLRNGSIQMKTRTFTPNTSPTTTPSPLFPSLHLSICRTLLHSLYLHSMCNGKKPTNLHLQQTIRGQGCY